MFEKRQHPRRPLEVDVTVHHKDGRSLPARSVDMSVGGMFVTASDLPAFGSEVTIEIELPGLGPTRLPAFVRWTKPDGFGVQFGLIGVRETHAIGVLVSAS